MGLALIYGLNLVAATRMIAPELRPHRVTVGIGILGFVFAIAGAVLLLVTRVLA